MFKSEGSDRANKVTCSTSFFPQLIWPPAAWIMHAYDKGRSTSAINHCVVRIKHPAREEKRNLMRNFSGVIPWRKLSFAFSFEPRWPQELPHALGGGGAFCTFAIHSLSLTPACISSLCIQTFHVSIVLSLPLFRCSSSAAAVVISAHASLLIASSF